MSLPRSQPSVASINSQLPQTQCQRCSYVDCQAYAEAIHEGGADINRCPPGGDATHTALADLLRRARATPDLARDVDVYAPEQVAAIDETACIGCAKCLPVCPTDAIIGASKRIHTVIADHCTGCELCIIACPVDCISLRSAITPANQFHISLTLRAAQTQALRQAYERHKTRWRQRAETRRQGRASSDTGQHAPADSLSLPAKPDKASLLADILARARKRI